MSKCAVWTWCVLLSLACAPAYAQLANEGPATQPQQKDDAPKAAMQTVEFGGYQLSLPQPWQPKAFDPENGIIATCSNDGQLVGVIMAAELPRPVETEWSQMVTSAKANTEAFTPLDAGAFTTSAGEKGAFFLTAIRASHPQLGAPLILHSMYVPTGDETSTTFKLQTSGRNLKWLWIQFENIVSTAKRVAPENDALENVTRDNDALEDATPEKTDSDPG